MIRRNLSYLHVSLSLKYICPCRIKQSFSCVPTLIASMVKAVPKKAGAKRHKAISRPNIETGVTKPGVKRLAHQAGALRVAANVVVDVRSAVEAHLTKILSVARRYCGDRKTLKVSDCVQAYRFIGHPVFGYDDARLKAN